MGSKSLSSEDMLESEKDFGIAYETHAESIYRFFYWRTQDSELSQDLTSSVFEKAWRSKESFQGGSVRAWLYRIARNLLIDHWRHKQDMPLTNQDTLVSDTEELSVEVDKQLMAEQLQQALTQLPTEMHYVVSLRFIEGLSCKHVARLTGLSESNVRVTQYRALKKLRKYLYEK
jgi:RNA polymerase sigma-70 factor (ECF subfamily)